MYDTENEGETSTTEHVLAVIDSNSNVTEYNDSVETTQGDFDNEDPGEVTRAIVAIKKEDGQTTYRDDDYKYVNHNNQ